ncbi:MAG: MBL fold metallo-hydrolase [Muribaculaceae bacterium]|nr:MBL fold metallo-hydrolase [Muribaculaceae bacterium]
MLNIKQFVFNPFDENTYIVSDADSGEAIVVDPGMSNEAENSRFDKYVADNHLKITEVVLTHMHLDHCFGANHIQSRYGAPIAASAADAILGVSIAGQAARFGIYMPESEAVRASIDLTDGDIVKFGAESLQVLAVPGHSCGGIALYSRAGKVVFTGDSLFRRSIGRTDLPGGNHNELIDSVRSHLLTLPPDTLVLPGHGPSTTIGEELLGNPFVV